MAIHGKTGQLRITSSSRINLAELTEKRTGIVVQPTKTPDGLSLAPDEGEGHRRTTRLLCMWFGANSRGHGVSPR